MQRCVMSKNRKGTLRLFGHVNVNGKTNWKRSRKTWHDQMNQITEPGHVKSRNKRRVDMYVCDDLGNFLNMGIHILNMGRCGCQDRVDW